MVRKILKKIAFAGGIHIRNASEILNVAYEDIAHYLEALGLQAVTDGWYSFTDSSQFNKQPLRTAGLKMIEACGEIPIDKFIEGIRQYARRFTPEPAPKVVILALLEILGFSFGQPVFNGYPNEN